MKIRSLLLILFLLSSLLFAQASAESAMYNSDYYTATDANNRTLKLAQKPSISDCRKSRKHAGQCAVVIRGSGRQ